MRLIKRIAFFLVLLIFLGSSIFLVQQLFFLKSVMMRLLELDHEEYMLIQPELTNINLSIGVCFLTGLLAVLLNYTLKEDEVEIVALDMVSDKEISKQITGQREAEEGSSKQRISEAKAILDNIMSEASSLGFLLKGLANHFQAGVGLLYNFDNGYFSIQESYALLITEELKNTKYEIGEGLVGQCAKNGELVFVELVPAYMPIISSGLGYKKPNFLLIIPFFNNHEKEGFMVELGLLSKPKEDDIKALEQWLKEKKQEQRTTYEVELKNES